MSEKLYEAQDTVGMVLMGSEEAEAAVAMLREKRPDLAITDDSCFYSISGVGNIEIDLQELGERLGRDLAPTDFQVVLSSFYGRVDFDAQRFGVYAELLGLEDSQP